MKPFVKTHLSIFALALICTATPHAVFSQSLDSHFEASDAKYELQDGWEEWADTIIKNIDRLSKKFPDKPIIYLSGPISTGGAWDMAENFKRGIENTKLLEAAGYIVVSPFVNESSRKDNQLKDQKLESLVVFEEHIREKIKTFSHASFMFGWEKVLKDPRIKGAIMMPGYETSSGAAIEMGSFIAYEKPIRLFKANDSTKGFELNDYDYNPVMSMVDHTLLTPGSTDKDIEREARWALKNNARGMVVRPEHVATATTILKNTMVLPKAVIGFPTEKFTDKNYRQKLIRNTAQKVNDAIDSIDAAADNGAEAIELDMIINVENLKEATIREKAARAEERLFKSLKTSNPAKANVHWQNALNLASESREYIDKVKADIDIVLKRSAAHAKKKKIGARVMVILETSLLTKSEIATASKIVRSTSAVAVKTNTGFGPRGSSDQDVRIMREVVGLSKLIKAAGSVSKETIFSRRNAGANVFGMSGSRDVRGHNWRKLKAEFKRSTAKKSHAKKARSGY